MNSEENSKHIIITEVRTKPDEMVELYEKKSEDLTKKFFLEQSEIKEKIKYVKKPKLESFIKKVNIILFTATNIEKNKVLKYLRPLKKEDSILCCMLEYEIYFVGCFGAYNIALVMCNPGSIQPDSIAFASYDAFIFWHPKVAILCGIAYGLYEEKHNFGDVIISNKIIFHDVEKISEDKISRGIKPSTSIKLLNIFKNEIGWEYELPNNIKAKKIFGSIISSERLINNLEYRENLKSRYHDAVGGEMEGAGLWSSSYRKNVESIVVKGICDWGYNKTNNFQPIAADSAISLVHHVFNIPNIFESLKIPMECLNSGKIKQFFTKLKSILKFRNTKI